MKKMVLVVSLVLAALVTLVSCNEENGFRGNPRDRQDPTAIPEFPEPLARDLSIKLSIPKTTPSGEANIVYDQYHSFEFTESGHYIVVTAEKLSQDDSDIYEIEEKVLTGDYSSKLIGPVTVYQMEDFGEVRLEEATKAVELIITIIVNGSQAELKTVVTEDPKMPESPMVNAICRSWKVVETDIDVKKEGGGTGVEKTYKGCDFHAIAVDLHDQGIKINPDRLVGYNVQSILLTASRTLSVEFEARDPYLGEFDTINEDGAFNYSFSKTYSDNTFLQANATGRLSFNNGKALLKVSGKASENENKYNVGIVFYMVPEESTL